MRSTSDGAIGVDRAGRHPPRQCRKARGGAGVVIASQSGHRLPAITAEQNMAPATTPADELLALPLLQPDQIADSFRA
jgi:hypothetical protein